MKYSKIIKHNLKFWLCLNQSELETICKDDFWSPPFPTYKSDTGVLLQLLIALPVLFVVTK